MVLRYLRRNATAQHSCILVIHFVVVSRHQQTSPLARADCHGQSQLSILHLPLQAFTACDGARYWLRIAISAYPTCIRRPLLGFPSEYCHDVSYIKTRMVWLLDGEKVKICLFVLIESRSVTDRCTDRQSDRHRMTEEAALMYSIARQKPCRLNETHTK